MGNHGTKTEREHYTRGQSTLFPCLMGRLGGTGGKRQLREFLPITSIISEKDETELILKGKDWELMCH